MSGLKAGGAFEMVSGEAFDADKAYKDSKLCNVLFARELSRRLAEQESTVTVNSFGPGVMPRVQLEVHLEVINTDIY
jgi:protochlorophyllide reductase